MSINHWLNLIFKCQAVKNHNVLLGILGQRGEKGFHFEDESLALCLGRTKRK